MKGRAVRRFFVEEIKTEDGACSILGREAKHISKVLRMTPGDRFTLMDGKGRRFLALIESSNPREVRVILEKALPGPLPSPVDISLCQSLLKSRAMDYLVQKTSELGVASVCPFTSERTVVRLEKDRSSNRIRHWREIAQSAAKQSGRAAPAEIGPLTSFRELMARWKGEDVLKVILWEEERSKDLKTLLRASSSMKTYVCIVGPEGGFTREEIDVARDAGFVSVSVGNRILRSETAAIAMVAIVQYELGDLSLSKNKK